jgi:hypothetical protein
MVVDNLQPLLERKQAPVCTRHALLWHRQGRGSIWVFPLGEGESQNLTEEQILAVFEAELAQKEKRDV